jgi:hypothetical protein
MVNLDPFKFMVNLDPFKSMVNLNPFKFMVGEGWFFHANCRASRHYSTGQHNPHNASLAHQPAVAVFIKHRPQQPWQKAINLAARVAQPSHLHHGTVTEVQQRAGRQCQQRQPTGGDVFANITWLEHKTFIGQFGKKLAVQQMHLAQVGLAGVCRHPRAVLDGHALVGIVFDPQTGQKPNL